MTRTATARWQMPDTGARCAASRTAPAARLSPRMTADARVRRSAGAYFGIREKREVALARLLEAGDAADLQRRRRLRAGTPTAPQARSAARCHAGPIRRSQREYHAVFTEVRSKNLARCGRCSSDATRCTSRSRSWARARGPAAAATAAGSDTTASERR